MVDFSLTFYQTFSYAVVHFGDIPATCVAIFVPSCTKDHQKSHRTHWQSKQISVHLVTDCLTQMNNKRGSISSGIVSIPFCNRLTEKRKNTELTERTAELYSKQGNADIPELVIIDETTQCE